MLQIPRKIEGVPLTSSQRKRLISLFNIIQKANPHRDSTSNLKQAVGSFQMTVTKRGLRWVDKPTFRLNNGKGAVVVPKWAYDPAQESDEQ